MLYHAYAIVHRLRHNIGHAIFDDIRPNSSDTKLPQILEIYVTLLNKKVNKTEIPGKLYLEELNNDKNILNVFMMNVSQLTTIRVTLQYKLNSFNSDGDICNLKNVARETQNPYVSHVEFRMLNFT